MAVQNVRNPGYLPNVAARVEAARQMLAQRDLDEDLRKVIQSLLDLATTQHELNKHLWESNRGLPYGVLDALAEAGIDLSPDADGDGSAQVSSAKPAPHTHLVPDVRGIVGDTELVLAAQVFGA